MKFTEHLSAHITPEWRKQYIQYEELKALVYAAVEQSPASESVEPEVLSRYYAKFDERFFNACDKELTKINTFFSEKLAEATRKFTTLQSELSMAREAQNRSSSKKDAGGMSGTPTLLLKRNREDHPMRKMQDLKLAFSEFYLSLILLQNYQNLNFTGFRKILKKHDKLVATDVGGKWHHDNVEQSVFHMNTSMGIDLVATDVGGKWHRDNVEQSVFHMNKDIDRLIQETEGVVTLELEGGDRQKAMKRLRVPPLGEQQSPWTTFKVGLFSGAFLVLGATVVLSAIFYESRDDWRVILRLYRGPFLFVIFLFLMGVNVYGWRSSGVNHVLIFELDPRHHLSEQHIMELAASFGVIWSVSVLCFFYSSSLSIPAYASPLGLMIMMLLFIFNPTKTFNHEARFWLLRILGRIVCAPFFYVGFADFWLADQLNSLVPAFQDIQYLICFYVTNDGDWNNASGDRCIETPWMIRPIVTCLPAWFRFAQCLRRYRDTREAFPHLVNAGKYSTTFFVVLFSTLNVIYKGNYVDSTENPFFYLWIVASVFSSCYAYTWDIKMDWGLFDKHAGDNQFLREEIVYSSKGYYYFAIVEDLILRFGWALSLSLTEMGYIHSDLMVSILAPLEVFRRFVWNFFRLENEHLNNCGKFRAVRDISVAPMDSSDQAQILRIMDEENSVVNRRKRRATPQFLGGGGRGGEKKKSEKNLLLKHSEMDETPEPEQI